jgi:putative FmdB family regulatory protein
LGGWCHTDLVAQADWFKGDFVMPTYEMVCDGCEHEFEVVHPMADPHPKKCPACKKQMVRVNYKKAPAYQNKYSPMHPRAKRGRGH